MNPRFTKKHYEAVARVINDVREEMSAGNCPAGINAESYLTGIIDTICEVRVALSNVFADDNQAFDRVKFDLACMKDTLDRTKKLAR